MTENNLIRTFKTEDMISSNSEKEISVTIPEKDEPVYLLIGTLKYADTESIVNIRYVRDEVDKVRLNFPAVTKFPLNKGEDTTLFTCLHNSGQSHQVTNNKVILEVRNAKGKVTESHIYEGPITGDMMAIKKDFKPKKNLDKFSVYSAIYTDDKLVDESTMEYDCQLIDSSTCQKKDNNWIIILLSSIVLIVVFFVVIKLKNNKG